MRCLRCEVEGETRYVELHQSICLLVGEIGSEVKGYLCGPCRKRCFWRTSLVTLLLGWWGLPGLFMTPVYLANNVGYLAGWGAVPTEADRLAYEEKVARGEDATPRRRTSPLAWAFILLFVGIVVWTAWTGR